MPGTEIDEKTIPQSAVEALNGPTKDDVAQQKRYQKLLDDVLYAVAIFYSRQMGEFLSICGQPTALTIISLILLGLFSTLQGWVERHYSDYHGFHTLWTDIVKAWLATGTRTLAFLTVTFLMDMLKASMMTTEHSIVDIFVQPFMVLFLLISLVKYTSCLSIEAYSKHRHDVVLK